MPRPVHTRVLSNLGGAGRRDLATSRTALQGGPDAGILALEVEPALDIVAQIVRAAHQSNLFPAFQQPQVSNIISSLSDGVLDGSVQRVADVLCKLNELLDTEHPVLRLFIQAQCVKALSMDLWTEDPGWDSSEEETLESEGRHPLVAKTPEEIGDFLLRFLNEQTPMHQKLVKIARMFGADGVWQMLQDVDAAVANNSPEARTQQGKERSAGAIFLNMAKTREATERKNAQRAPSAQLELRSYQAKAVNRITAEGGNWVVAAPTNTGKTAIFIELSRRCLQLKPSGTVVVLVPTVPLSRQHCNKYEESGYFRLASGYTAAGPALPAVDWFSGEKQLAPSEWKDVHKRLGVIVIGAKSFLNVLDSGHASMADVDMLVLDECHHTSGGHPYAAVMAHVMQLDKQARPQVLGFSALPADGRTPEACMSNVAQLQHQLQAKLEIIREDDILVRQVAPGPTQEEEIVKPRAQDGCVQEWLRHLMHAYAMYVDSSLEEKLNLQQGSPPTQPHDLADARAVSCVPTSLREVLSRAPSAAAVSWNERQAYGDLCRWMNVAMEVACYWKLPNLGQSIQVLEVLRQAEAMCTDVGFECALQHTAHHMLSKASVPPAEFMDVYLPAARERPWYLTDVEQLEADVSAALPALRNRVATGPSASEIAQAAQAGNPLHHIAPCADIDLTAKTLCHRFVHDFSTWDPLREEGPLAGVLPTGLPVTGDAAPAPSDVCTLLASAACVPFLPGGMSDQCHPKIWRLVQFLQEYKDKADFHGIVFCRSRKAAHYVTELLRAACVMPSTRLGRVGGAELGFIEEVMLFVGHGGDISAKGRNLGSMMPGLVEGRATYMAPEDGGIATRGMSIKQQQATLERFKGPGRKVLVATNAAEEGLDLPCCEFVVRYSPPATGIQRVQGMGRARKPGARYLCLIQPPMPTSLLTDDDTYLHEKSKAEDENRRHVLMLMAERQKQLE